MVCMQCWSLPAAGHGSCGQSCWHLTGICCFGSKLLVKRFFNIRLLVAAAVCGQEPQPSVAGSRCIARASPHASGRFRQIVRSVVKTANVRLTDCTVEGWPSRCWSSLLGSSGVTACTAQQYLCHPRRRSLQRWTRALGACKSRDIMSTGTLDAHVLSHGARHAVLIPCHAQAALIRLIAEERMLASIQSLNPAKAATCVRLGIHAALPLCRVCRSPLRAMSSATDSAATEVAVIGAGISGLHCARTLSQYGYTVTVFDMGKGSPGGVHWL